MQSSVELVSIIIPTYERETFISEAIESVLAQTYSNFEVLVIDDGSTDRTGLLVKSLGSEDSRIRYVYQDNRGHSAARNKGIELSRGSLLAFLDSDDLWKPEKLQKQVDIFHDHPDISLVYCSGSYIDEKGEPTAENSNAVPSALYTAESILLEHVVFLTSGVAIRRSCLQHSGMFDESLPFFEDLDLWFRILLFSGSYFLDQELILKRIHSQNFQANRPHATAEAYSSAVQMRRKAVQMFEQHVRPLTSKEKETALYNYQLDLIKESLALGLLSRAGNEILSYWGTHPLRISMLFYWFLSLLPGPLVSRVIQKRRERMVRRDKIL